MKRGARGLAAGVSIAALLWLLVSGWIANHFIFYPARYPQGEWELQSRAGAHDRQIRTSDGILLHAWWLPLDGAKFATLFLHGNAGNITHRLDHADRIHEAGSAVLLLDYRGYGKSEGHPSEKGLYLDAEAAYDELLRTGWQPQRIVLHGESLGTAVAVELATRKQCAGIILESPLMSIQDIAAGLIPWLGPALVRGFDSRSRIARIHAPLLVIHGDRDEVVPFAQGRTLFEAAPQPKWFWPVRGGTHNELLYAAGEEYVPRLRAFYATLSAR